MSLLAVLAIFFVSYRGRSRFASASRRCRTNMVAIPGVLVGEMENRNHSITWITETIIGNTITNGARLVRIRSCGQNDDADVTVSGGKRMSIDIDKTECIALSIRKRPM